MILRWEYYPRLFGLSNIIIKVLIIGMREGKTGEGDATTEAYTGVTGL